MRTNKLLIFFLFALVLVSLVYAAPPFQSTSNGGLQFAYSAYEVVKADTLFKLHIHVINDTAIQTNATTSCIVHLYNSEGGHILQSGMGYDSNNIEFKLDIGAGNFTKGQHAYIIQCNNTNKQIHLVNGLFHVTPNGNELTTADAITINWQVLILILTVIVFMTMAIIFRIDSVKIFFFVLAGLTLFLLIGISMLMTENYLYSYLQYASTLSAFYIVVAIVGGVAIIGLVIWFIYTILSQFSKTKIGNLDNEDID